MPRPRNTQIRVYVIEFRRDSFMLRIKYPSGKIEHESAGTGDRTEADRRAGAREAELRANAPQPHGKMAWTAFRKLLEEQLLPEHAPATQRKYRAVLNVFERICQPRILGDATTANMSKFVAAWRAEGAAEATLFGAIGHLKAAMAWAVEQEYLDVAPVIRKPSIVERDPTRGRAITDAELAKFLKAVPEIVGDKAKEWTRVIEGLNLSGLRLGEAVSLSWNVPGTIQVDLAGDFPMLRIPGSEQKNRKSTLWPMTPDFAAFLLKTPKTKRTGYVFQFPMPVKSATEFRRVDTIGKIIVAIGEKSGIIVDAERGKTVSAHDLRRTFGLRWSLILSPQELQELMRHSSFETTLKYYIRQKSNTTAAVIWEKGNMAGNKPRKTKPPKRKTD